MHHDEKLRDKLLTYIQDAYAMENHIAEVLEKQVKDTKQFPEVQARIEQHLEETKIHRTRMEDRLKAYGKSPSSMKGALTNVMGNLQGALSGSRPDALAMNARDDYATEHLEIASYALLIATAHLFGDSETVRACELNLHDEVKMATWLEQHAAQAALLSLEQDGISVPANAIPNAQQAIQVGLQEARGLVNMSPEAPQELTTPGGLA